MENRYPTLKKALAILALLALWELLPRSGVLNPLFVPPLSSVVTTLRDLYSNGELVKHTLVSLQRAIYGLLAGILVGLPLGLLLGGWFPRIQQATEPLMELFAQANPVILAHIIIFFLSIGQSARIFIIAWLCIWPITFSTITGIRTVDTTLLKQARSFGLGRWRLFVRVIRFRRRCCHGDLPSDAVGDPDTGQLQGVDSSALDLNHGLTIDADPCLRDVRTDSDFYSTQRSFHRNRSITTCDGARAASDKAAATDGHVPACSGPVVMPARDADQ